LTSDVTGTFTAGIPHS